MGGLVGSDVVRGEDGVGCEVRLITVTSANPADCLRTSALQQSYESGYIPTLIWSFLVPLVPPARLERAT